MRFSLPFGRHQEAIVGYGLGARVWDRSRDDYATVEAPPGHNPEVPDRVVVRDINGILRFARFGDLYPSGPSAPDYAGAERRFAAAKEACAKIAGDLGIEVDAGGIEAHPAVIEMHAAEAAWIEALILDPNVTTPRVRFAQRYGASAA
jgi:hypothetical protein